jgi:PAS domain S-box-containing protein
MIPASITLAYDFAPIALCLTQHRTITHCNRAFLELFGFEAGELTGQSIAQLYPSPEEYERIGQRGYPQMEHGGPYQDERLMRRSDGALIWCRVRGQAADAGHPEAASAWSFEPLSQNVPDVQRLSPREREVVALVAQGLTSKEMARQLGLSPRTVEMHRARLRLKLGARSTPRLLRLLP